MKHEEQAKKIQQIIAKAWSDEDYKQKLLSETAATMLAEGIDLPIGIELKIVENTPQVTYMVLPLKPLTTELNDEQLGEVAGGRAMGRGRSMRDTGIM
jgi:hypothetical protein